MSITATRFATHSRTWLLIAALTGLLIAIVGAIGGGALYVFVVLAVAMVLVGYWFSDRIALAAIVLVVAGITLEVVLGAAAVHGIASLA